jgi:hypothetical protein
VARDFLDNLFDQYETLDNLSRVAEFANTASLFGNEGAYQQIRRDGVGRTVIEQFLGGTFATGQDVQNALARLPLSDKQRATKEREDASTEPANWKSPTAITGSRPRAACWASTTGTPSRSIRSPTPS